MAVTNGPRFGLTRWSDRATDRPTMTQFDADNQRVEDLAAIDLQVAFLADRPAPGIRGRYCYVLADSALYRDTGSEWRSITETSTAPPTTVGPALAASAGTSRIASKADHRHALPAYAGTPPILTASAGAAGTADTFARGDHRHEVRTAAPLASNPGDTTSAGTSADLTRADHRHEREFRDSWAYRNTSSFVLSGTQFASIPLLGASSTPFTLTGTQRVKVHFSSTWESYTTTGADLLSLTVRVDDAVSLTTGTNGVDAQSFREANSGTSWICLSGLAVFPSLSGGNRFPTLRVDHANGGVATHRFTMASIEVLD